jgi:hypothetical protein
MDAWLEHADGFADRASVNAILDSDAVTRPYRRNGRQDGRSSADRDDLWRPRRISAAPPQRRAVARLTFRPERQAPRRGAQAVTDPQTSERCRFYQTCTGLAAHNGIAAQSAHMCKRKTCALRCCFLWAVR